MEALALVALTLAPGKARRIASSTDSGDFPPALFHQVATMHPAKGMTPNTDPNTKRY
jgi:hypothetical protein